MSTLSKAFFEACQNNQLGIAKALLVGLPKEEMTQKMFDYAMSYSIAQDDFDFLELLIAKKITMNINSCLRYAKSINMIDAILHFATEQHIDLEFIKKEQNNGSFIILHLRYSEVELIQHFIDLGFEIKERDVATQVLEDERKQKIYDHLAFFKAKKEKEKLDNHLTYSLPYGINRQKI